jgi:hypothetical protein
VRDGAILARIGIPVVAVVTEQFVDQADFVARAAGVPGVPRYVLPHPCAGTGQENLARVAGEAGPGILALLRGIS